MLVQTSQSLGTYFDKSNSTFDNYYHWSTSPLVEHLVLMHKLAIAGSCWHHVCPGLVRSCDCILLIHITDIVTKMTKWKYASCLVIYLQNRSPLGNIHVSDNKLRNSRQKRVLHSYSIFLVYCDCLWKQKPGILSFVNMYLIFNFHIREAEEFCVTWHNLSRPCYSRAYQRKRNFSQLLHVSLFPNDESTCWYASQSSFKENTITRTPQHYIVNLLIYKYCINQCIKRITFVT